MKKPKVVYEVTGCGDMYVDVINSVGVGGTKREVALVKAVRALVLAAKKAQDQPRLSLDYEHAMWDAVDQLVRCEHALLASAKRHAEAIENAKKAKAKKASP
jgi:hypothetical protein